MDAWGLSAFVNCNAQAAVCRMMELDASTLAMRRLLKLLLASIAFNGLLWGLVPWLMVDSGLEAVIFASLLNVMLLFCIASAPGTKEMIGLAAPPITLFGPVALLRASGQPAIALGYLLLATLVGFYGLRLTGARMHALAQRFVAEDLAIELKAQQERLVEVEHERTLLRERERLMKDMHDGLGAALVASLVAAERGEVRPEQLAMLLRDCVDELRAVIDSLEPSDHDLATLLGTMRSRLERRLTAAGMRLEWQIDDLPPLLWMGAPEALQVMRILQEIVTNSIKHSKARCLRITASAAARGMVEVSVADDGVGFDVSAAPVGRGLRFLQQRARVLGGGMEFVSSLEKGAVARLFLPVSQGLGEAAAVFVAEGRE